ncbi:MAG: Rieske 2Fe-2S domain-containing protein [Chloroflexi bacterium]|nr:Rieske 2Fe-2S domain-containing protein [Chloroflexota bacterium]
MLGFRSRRTADSPLLERRRADSYPHPYPTGWYRLASTDSLRRGELRYLECLGKQFVLWREQQSGEIRLMDAFCPHLGANLGRGQVRGDCIECPFHLWQFSGDGRVSHIPYSDQPPARVLTPAYSLTDVHGDLYLFHRSDGSPDDRGESPPYEVPRLPEVDDGRFVQRGRRNAGRVRMHVMEIAENAADLAHFQALHSQLTVPWTQIPVPGVQLVHSVKSWLDPVDQWLMRFEDHASLRAFGREFKGLENEAQVSFVGPGSLLMFRFRLGDYGEIVMYQSFLPIGPLEQQVDFRWFADRKVPRMLVWYVVGNWISQFPQDIAIWEHKVHVDQPKLCRDDGPVTEFRRWYRQFLPEDSVSDGGTEYERATRAQPPRRPTRAA